MRLVVDGILAADDVSQQRNHFLQVRVLLELKPVTGRNHSRGDAGGFDAPKRLQHARERGDVVRERHEVLLPAVAEALGIGITEEAGDLAAGDAEGLVGFLVGHILSQQLLNGHDERLDAGPFGVDERSVYVKYS